MSAMFTRVTRSILLITVASSAAYLLYAVDPVKAGIKSAAAHEFFVQDHRYFWYFSPDSTFEPYLENFFIQDDAPVNRLDVEICQHLEGQHHSSTSRIVNSVKHRDIYCEINVAGHVTNALVASLQLR